MHEFTRKSNSHNKQDVLEEKIKIDFSNVELMISQNLNLYLFNDLINLKVQLLQNLNFDKTINYLNIANITKKNENENINFKSILITSLYHSHSYILKTLLLENNINCTKNNKIKIEKVNDNIILNDIIYSFHTIFKLSSKFISYDFYCKFIRFKNNRKFDNLMNTNILFFNAKKIDDKKENENTNEISKDYLDKLTIKNNENKRSENILEELRILELLDFKLEFSFLNCMSEKISYCFLSLFINIIFLNVTFKNEKDKSHKLNCEPILSCFIEIFNILINENMNHLEMCLRLMDNSHSKYSTSKLRTKNDTFKMKVNNEENNRYIKTYCKINKNEFIKNKMEKNSEKETINSVFNNINKLNVKEKSKICEIYELIIFNLKKIVRFYEHKKLVIFDFKESCMTDTSNFLPLLNIPDNLNDFVNLNLSEVNYKMTTNKFDFKNCSINVKNIITNSNNNSLPLIRLGTNLANVKNFKLTKSNFDITKNKLTFGNYKQESSSNSLLKNNQNMNSSKSVMKIENLKLSNVKHSQFNLNNDNIKKINFKSSFNVYNSFNKEYKIKFSEKLNLKSIDIKKTSLSKILNIT